MIEIKNKENNRYYQNNPIYFDEVIKIFNEYPKHFNRMFNHSKKYLGDWINSQLPLLQDKIYSFSTKLHWIVTNRTNFPICEYDKCKKILGLNKNVEVVYGYAHYCCNRHAQLDIKTINKVKHTKLINHGNPNYCNTEKIKQTCLNHFGKTSALSVKEIREKGKQTRERLYGDPNYNNREKSIQTRLKHFNGQYAPSDYGIKCAQTYLKRTNGKYKNALQNPEVRSKMKRRYFYDYQFFDSSWEVAFYIWHKDHNIKIKYEPCTIKYIGLNNKEHVYHPDFLINENELIEIKGNHFIAFEDNKIVLVNPFNHTKEAQEQAKFLYNEVILKNNVKLLSYNNIKPYINYIKNKYGRNYINTFRVVYNKKGV